MEYSEFKKVISDLFRKFIGIELSDEQCHCFFYYMNLLIEKNKVMNLTTIDEPYEIIIRHFVDSSILVNLFGKDFFDKKKVIDVGTGAGFPGLPLAIVCPNGIFVLTDTLGKRINFLNEVLEKIELKNVTTLKSRAEDLGSDKNYRERFDYAISRAVSNLSVLSEYNMPLVRVGGQMLSYKMGNCDEELEAAKKAIDIFGGVFHVKHLYKLIPDEPSRCILEIKKIKATPKRFPRKAGTPSKEPIL